MSSSTLFKAAFLVQPFVHSLVASKPNHTLQLEFAGSDSVHLIKKVQRPVQNTTRYKTPCVSLQMHAHGYLQTELIKQLHRCQIFILNVDLAHLDAAQ